MYLQYMECMEPLLTDCGNPCTLPHSLVITYCTWWPVGVSIGSSTPKLETIEACGRGEGSVDLAPTAAPITMLVLLLAVEADDLRGAAGDCRVEERLEIQGIFEGVSFVSIDERG
jgi:hypothetical protein